MDSSDNLSFLQLLTIDDVEVWHVKSSQAHCKARGTLQVLYSDYAELFILRIEDQKWILDNTLEVIVIPSEVEKSRSYLIPNHDGFYMIKVADAGSTVPLTNFENILEKVVVFMRRGHLEEKLVALKKNNGLLAKAEAAVMDGINSIADGIKNLLSPSTASHPNQTTIKSFKELKESDKQNTPIVELSKDEIHSTWDESEEIKRKSKYNMTWRGFKQGNIVSRTIGAPTPITTTPIPTTTNSAEVYEFGADDDDDIPAPVIPKPQEKKKDQQEFVGNENQRLPMYEIEANQEQAETGEPKTPLNLGCTTPIIVNPTSIVNNIADDEEDEEEEDEFTSGLMRPTETTTTEETLKASDITMTHQTSTASDKWSNTSNPSRSPTRADFGRKVQQMDKDLEIPASGTSNAIGENVCQIGTIPPQA